MNNISQLPVVVDHTNEHESQHLMFQLGQETFAIGILYIKEIIEYGEVTCVPMMPSYIQGVINLRGCAVPVVNLQARFNKAQSDISRRTCIVIVEISNGDQSQDVGIVVDSVSEVIDIPIDQIEPAPAFGGHIRADFIRGMGKINGKFVVILNVNKVLSFDDMNLLSTIV